MLKASGELVQHTAGGWSSIQVGAVRSFSLAGDGSLYVLTVAGQLLQHTAGRWSNVQVGAVRSFNVTGDGSLYVLTTTGNLLRHTPSGWITSAVGIASFGVAANGQIFYLGTNGVLGITDGFKQFPLFANVVSFNQAPSGSGVTFTDRFRINHLYESGQFKY